MRTGKEHGNCKILGSVQGPLSDALPPFPTTYNSISVGLRPGGYGLGVKNGVSFRLFWFGWVRFYGPFELAVLRDFGRCNFTGSMLGWPLEPFEKC